MSVDRVCQCCGKRFMAKAADVKRGWARFCSKRCKAIQQVRDKGDYRDRFDPEADHDRFHGQDQEFAFR